MEWLQKSSLTYENVALSARMLRLAIGSGIGARVTAQDIKRKYADLLQEYTASDNSSPLPSSSLSYKLPLLARRTNFPLGSLSGPQRLCNPLSSM